MSRTNQFDIRYPVTNEDNYIIHEKINPDYISYGRSSSKNMAYSMAELRDYAKQLGLPTTGN